MGTLLIYLPKNSTLATEQDLPFHYSSINGVRVPIFAVLML